MGIRRSGGRIWRRARWTVIIVRRPGLLALPGSAPGYAGCGNRQQARRLVIEEIKRAKREGGKVLKVIHGYGSSGKGGTLCVGLRKSFGLRKKEGVIKDFIAGEDSSIFNDTVLALLETVPEIRGDPDLNSINEGVTLLWLK